MISIGGVVVASHRTLAVSIGCPQGADFQTYLAVTSLPRPIMPPRPEEVEQPANSSKVKAFLTKPRVKKTLMVIFGIVATLALWAAVTGVFVALFRFTSQIVLDLCLVSLFGGFFTWTLWRVSRDVMAKLTVDSRDWSQLAHIYRLQGSIPQSHREVEKRSLDAPILSGPRLSS
jgi:hypothetical protein